MTATKHLLVIPVVLSLLALSGCALSPNTTRPATLYDSQLVDSQSRQVLSLEAVADAAMQADVVVIGEHHGHQASHLLQARLLQQLHSRNPNIVLTLEQFDLDRQTALNDYLAGITGETELVKDAKAWDNYRGSYRPLIEYARHHQLPVLAANAPADIVRCVGRQGPDYLTSLTDSQRRQLPDQPFLDTPAYRNKFITAITGSHGSNDPAIAQRMDNVYQAQLVRDNTMADRILQARRQYPDHQILHLTGTFHSEQKLGTVALLKQRAPELSIVVLSPVFWPEDAVEPPLQDNLNKGDFLYLIPPLAPEFRNSERRQEAMTERFKDRSGTDC
ncbi:ChaN family lipoprotein [Marinobacter sp.]|uniref:ChaN family lipoprotein n=1 Tax=Marinobacter sp. TaxID=50741 RepID=UPI002B2669D2|nr:ChaN family lipoprotein [Marinobacter sp.]